MTSAWYAVAIVVALASAFGLGYAIAELEGGFVDVPRHWWSTAPIVGFLVATLLGVIGRIRKQINRVEQEEE